MARAVYQGIRENPSLFFDPLSTNKIYRREFLDRHGIRFPEGVHYEDSLFSTEVYCQAATIAVIPNVVYYWRVVEDAEEASITHRRHEIENFRDRIAVHRMMDDFLRAHGAADLKVHKDFKFIRHDLKLYLTDLRAPRRGVPEAVHADGRRVPRDGQRADPRGWSTRWSASACT